MYQVSGSHSGPNHSGAEEPEPGTSRAAGNNSESFASLAVVSIANCYSGRAGYPADHRTGSEQLVRVLQVRTA